MIQCGAIAALIWMGHLTGTLTEVCLFIIAAFAAMCGLLPFLRSFNELQRDVIQCGEEHDDLIGIPNSKGEELLKVGTDGAGSLHQLAHQMVEGEGRASKEEITEAFFECFDEHWDARVETLRDAANYCPSLGIAGTMLGMGQLAGSLQADMYIADIGAAIAVMSYTTLAGGACFVLLSGLARRLTNSVAAHRKDLKYVASMFCRAGDSGSRGPRDINHFKQPGVA